MTVGWLDDDKTVIYRRIEGVWTWDEFYVTHHQAMKMMSSVDHTVSLLSEFVGKDTMTMPQQLFNHARNLFNDFPHNYGQVVFVGESMILRTVISTLAKVIPLKVTNNMQVVTSIEDAYRVLDLPEAISA